MHKLAVGALPLLLSGGACMNSVSAPEPREDPVPVDDPVVLPPPISAGEGEGEGGEGEEGEGDVNDEDPGFGDPVDPVDPPPPDEPDSPCSYPSTAGGFARTGDVIPPLSWDDARLPDGTRTTFDLGAWHCADDGKNGLVLLLSAGWCGNCPRYMQDLAPDVAALEAQGMKVALVLLENDASQPASGEEADEYASHYFSGSVLRLGDADTAPAGALYNSSIWSAFPGALVVEKSSMTVIANQDDQGQTLDFLGIAGDLGGGGSSPPPPSPPSGSGCSEEAGEPNDSVSQATPVTTTAAGSICDGARDFWQVIGSGSARITVSFRHADGDLDLEAVDGGGNRIAVSEGTADAEILDVSLPARFAVYGYGGAQGPYSVEVTR